MFQIRNKFRYQYFGSSSGCTVGNDPAYFRLGRVGMTDRPVFTFSGRFLKTQMSNGSLMAAKIQEGAGFARTRMLLRDRSADEVAAIAEQQCAHESWHYKPS